NRTVEFAVVDRGIEIHGSVSCRFHYDDAFRSRILDGIEVRIPEFHRHEFELRRIARRREPAVRTGRMLFDEHDVTEPKVRSGPVYAVLKIIRPPANSEYADAGDGRGNSYSALGSDARDSISVLGGGQHAQAGSAVLARI